MLERFRRRPYVATPHEPPAVDRGPSARIGAIDRRLEVVSLIPPSIRSRETWEVADRLLDERNAIRPPRPAQVPVIPSRSS